MFTNKTASQKRIDRAVTGKQIFRETEKPDNQAPRSVLPVNRKRSKYYAPDWMY